MGRYVRCATRGDEVLQCGEARLSPLGPHQVIGAFHFRHDHLLTHLPNFLDVISVYIKAELYKVRKICSQKKYCMHI